MLNDFFLIGLTVFLGIVGGKISEKLGVPELVGVVLVGIVFGESFLGFLSIQKLDSFKPLIDLALAFFGFFIGSELILDELKDIGIEIISILVFETLIVFLVVMVSINYFTSKLYAAVLFGAFAISTAPAATATVVWEYRSKGKLTTTILALVGLDDVVAILAYSIASSYVVSVFAEVKIHLLSSLGFFIQNIGLAVVLGSFFGLLLVLCGKLTRKGRDLFIIAIAMVILCSGAAEMVNASEILSTLIVGLVFSNYCVKAEATVNVARELISPIFTLFFALTGARLNVFLLSTIGLVGLIYLVTTMAGKAAGATMGAWISGASDEIKKYIGLCLFSQAGIVLGLASHIYHELSKYGVLGEEFGAYVLNTVISTSLILLFIGPLFVKYAITKTKEIGKISEEELQREGKTCFKN